jgi:hypothetical protein
MQGVISEYHSDGFWFGQGNVEGRMRLVSRLAKLPQLNNGVDYRGRPPSSRLKLLLGTRHSCRGGESAGVCDQQPYV